MVKVSGMGRLTRDPELKKTNGGKDYVNFSIAVDDRKSSEEGTTHFFNCTAWNNTAKIICNYLKKGNQICIYGELKTNSYENKDGQKVTTTFINVDSFEFAGGRGENKESSAPAETPSSNNTNDDDLPF